MMPSADELQADVPATPGEGLLLVRCDDELESPRQGIIHLLALLTVTAMILSFQKYMGRWGSNPGATFEKIMATVNLICNSAAWAASIVGVCVLIPTRIRQMGRRFQPGHWLVLYVLGSMTLFEAYAIVESQKIAFSGAGFDDDFRQQMLAYGLICLSLAVPPLTALIVCRRGIWKLAFGLLACSNVFNAILLLTASRMPDDSLFRFFDWYTWATPASYLVLLVVLAAVLLLDFRKWRQGDWLHWWGVAILAISLSIPLVWWMVRFCTLANP